MRHSLLSRVGHSLCWISPLSMSAAAATDSARTPCYSTPSAAIESVRPGSSPSPASQRGGYRVTGIQSDPVLGRRWAVVANCDHAEWPVLAVITSGSAQDARSRTNPIPMTIARSVPVVVHAGDNVRLWKQEDRLRIEVAGVSEESGGLGKTIRVRLLRRSADDQVIQEEFSGIVRGPSDVEMQP
jgi:Chaperone for flagella basal body P-ring formation